jgi:putative sugar O-methyltransferase
MSVGFQARGSLMARFGELHLNLGFRRLARRAILSAGELFGITMMRTRTRDKILDSAPWLGPYFLMAEKARLPNTRSLEASDRYLRYDNPHLEDLRRRYSGHPATDHVQWGSSNVEANVEMEFFRADNLYVFQSRRYSPAVFYATAAYVKEIDRLNLLDTLHEDDLFGAEIFDFHGKTVSRDLLDSVIEINFLDKHLNLGGDRITNVLDIGAGYGRLAHRLTSAIPNIGRYCCIDAVPESTFISDYYLKFRQMTKRCEVVPLDKMDELNSVPFDLAVNIHSFPECRATVIAWWLERLREMQVPWLFIVTGSNLGLTSHEGHGVRKDFRPLIEASGFRLAVQEQKFESARVLQNYGLYPAEYFLFQRV